MWYNYSMKTLITYCCRDCGKQIGDNSALYGQGRCVSCSIKIRIVSKKTKAKLSKRLKGNTYRLGKKLSEEHKIKISKALKGRKFSKETLKKMSKSRTGKKHHLFGKHHTKETLLKMSQSHKGRKCYWLGKQMSEKTKKKMSRTQIIRFKNPKNHPNYIDGASLHPYSQDFNRELKTKIRERDNNTCQICGINQINCKRKLSIHHIDYNKDNCKKDNLISLCLDCHMKTNGNKKLDRSYWFVYCRYLMENK